VRQRERLLQGLSVPPHMLLMSATPIPRTLALVQFGGLVLSTIASMPPGRSRVATQVVVDSETAREHVRNCCYPRVVVSALCIFSSAAAAPKTTLSHNRLASLIFCPDPRRCMLQSEKSSPVAAGSTSCARWSASPPAQIPQMSGCSLRQETLTTTCSPSFPSAVNPTGLRCCL
jgi:hypothetical protein